MRPKQKLRNARSVRLGACALMLAIQASAVALTANQADAQSASQITLDRHQVPYGRTVTVSGSTTPSVAGQRLALQFALPGRSWHTVSAARTGPV